ncbi:hypothetical protein ACE6JH_01945 [Streptomyces nigra]
MKVPVRGVAPGVRLTATAELLPLLTDPSGSTTPLKPVEATAQTWAVPWLAGLLLLVVAVTSLLVRRARARRREREAVRVREAVERALQEA